MLKDIKCPLCKNQKSCAIMGIGDYAIEKCGMFNPVDKIIKTNGDKIRAMTDDELAELLWDVWRHKEPFYKESVDEWLVPFYHWLKQEATDAK